MHAFVEIRSELLRLKCDVAALRFQIAMRRYAIALKAGFDPDQPRDEWGRWTDGGGGAVDDNGVADIETVADEEAVFEDDASAESEGDATDISDARRRPGIGHNQRPPIKDPSDIPPERPESAAERNRIAQAIARDATLAAFYLSVVATGAHHWLHETYWEIKANQDPPKTLDELHDAVLKPDKRGYDDHHIVLRSARGPGIAEGRVKGLDNIVRIPRYKHWQINRWYETVNEEFGGLSPREYLKGKSWEENRYFGLRALRDVGVLRQ